MFSKQRQFVPKTLPKPKVKVRTVPVETPSTSSNKPRTPLNGNSSSSRGPSGSTNTSTSNRKTPSRPSSAIGGIGLKRTVSAHRSRPSNSPFASSSADDERIGNGGGYLAPPPPASAPAPASAQRNNSNNNKRVRSPTTDSDRTRVAFEPSDDEADDDDDWENRLKRRRYMERTDPARNLRNAALTELAEAGYGVNNKGGRALRFVHAAEVVSLAHGDAKVFPEASPEELLVELQYPGSLTRERFELAKQKDKLDAVKDIIRVVNNVKETFMTDEGVKAEFDSIIRQLQRNSNDRILNLAAFKEAVDKYNKIVLDHLESGAIVASIDKQHIPSNNLVSLILNQVYDRVVTPQVDALKRYQNGTDNVYGEMKHSFVTQALSTNLNMTSNQVFVDLGSGVGNVVLQAALQIGCESWGCEMMGAPSDLAKQQYQEFKARCKLWGIQPGKVRLIQGNFTNNAEIREVLKRADVVLANNQAFTPDLNETLKIMFLDLKKGCKVVSLKKFTTSSKHNVNDIANTILSEPEHYRWPGKGVSWTDEVGDYHISTKIEAGGES